MFLIKGLIKLLLALADLLGHLLTLRSEKDEGKDE
jgi:hypothetical protein